LGTRTLRVPVVACYPAGRQGVKSHGSGAINRIDNDRLRFSDTAVASLRALAALDAPDEGRHERGREGDVVGEHRQQAPPRPVERITLQQRIDLALDHAPVDADESRPRQQLQRDEQQTQDDGQDLADLLERVARDETGDRPERQLLYVWQYRRQVWRLHAAEVITPLTRCPMALE